MKTDATSEKPQIKPGGTCEEMHNVLAKYLANAKAMRGPCVHVSWLRATSFDIQDRLRDIKALTSKEMIHGRLKHDHMVHE